MKKTLVLCHILIFVLASSALYPDASSKDLFKLLSEDNSAQEDAEGITSQATSDREVRLESEENKKYETLYQYDPKPMELDHPIFALPLVFKLRRYLPHEFEEFHSEQYSKEQTSQNYLKEKKAREENGGKLELDTPVERLFLSTLSHEPNSVTTQGECDYPMEAFRKTPLH